MCCRRRCWTQQAVAEAQGHMRTGGIIEKDGEGSRTSVGEDGGRNMTAIQIQSVSSRLQVQGSRLELIWSRSSCISMRDIHIPSYNQWAIHVFKHQKLLYSIRTLGCPPSVSSRWFSSGSWQIGGIMNNGMLGEGGCKRMPSFALQTSVCQLQQWQSILPPTLPPLSLEW